MRAFALPQIVRLAGGMRHVALSFDSEEAVAESVAFLRRAFPLGHTAPIKKSQVGQTTGLRGLARLRPYLNDP